MKDLYQLYLTYRTQALAKSKKSAAKKKKRVIPKAAKSKQSKAKKKKRVVPKAAESKDSKAGKKRVIPKADLERLYGMRGCVERQTQGVGVTGREARWDGARWANRTWTFPAPVVAKLRRRRRLQEQDIAAWAAKTEIPGVQKMKKMRQQGGKVWQSIRQLAYDHHKLKKGLSSEQLITALGKLRQRLPRHGAKLPPLLATPRQKDGCPKKDAEPDETFRIPVMRGPFQVMETGEKPEEYREMSWSVARWLMHKDGSPKVHDEVMVVNGFGGKKPRFWAKYRGFGYYPKGHKGDYSYNFSVNVKKPLWVIRYGPILRRKHVNRNMYTDVAKEGTVWQGAKVSKAKTVRAKK